MHGSNLKDSKSISQSRDEIESEVYDSFCFVLSTESPNEENNESK